MREMDKRDSLIDYVRTDDLVKDVREIIEASRGFALSMVNVALVRRNWLLGCRILEEGLDGESRAEYGAEVIKDLSKNLSQTYGKGFSRSSLYQYVQFARMFPGIFQTPSGKSKTLLSWSHYVELIRVLDREAREWYTKEAMGQNWSVRTLRRNIDTQYYYRLLASQAKESVEGEMRENTAVFQEDGYRVLEFVKNPVIAEFLGFSQDANLHESELESAILANLQKFLMELGKGYAFVGRQYHVRGQSADYYIDLVFYNYLLKCFVLIDLKIGRITHEDVGQMDMYVRMFDELQRSEDDNPTLGIVLCSETDEDIARYSILKGNEQLFAAKYKLYLPSEEELRAEIEMQKTLYLLQREDASKERGEMSDAIVADLEG